MNKGDVVKIVRTGNNHAKQYVGKCGVIVGEAPLDILIIKLVDGVEYWASKNNLSVIR
jgi:hypothetical protein